MKAITTKYIPATNTRGARIKASDSDGNQVTIPYPHDLRNDAKHSAAAIALCEKMNWTGQLVCGGVKHGEVFVFLGGDTIPLK